MKFKDRADNKTIYTDYRRVLERKDIDVVAIATHPGWHALISIAAMEAGKDVLCEKPMTPLHRRGPRGGRGREALRPHLPGRHLRPLRRQPKIRKIIESGLLKKCDAVLIQPRRVQGEGVERQGEVRGRSRCPRTSTGTCTAGRRRCGPINRTASAARTAATGTTKAAAWPTWPTTTCTALAYQYGRDLTTPVEITPYAPPAHPECCGLWGWCELKYADGFTLVLESGEWGRAYDRLKQKNTGEGELLNMLSEEDRKKLDAMPDPEPLLSFPEAVRTRKPAGGNAERFAPRGHDLPPGQHRHPLRTAR